MHPIRIKDRLALLKYRLRHHPRSLSADLKHQLCNDTWKAWYGGRPFFLRKNTTDIHVFKKIFIDLEYSFSFDGEVANIIDAGANIGLTAVFFAVKYPKAKIIAIEPEESNYQQLLLNVAPYPNIIPLRGALANHNNYFRIKNKDGDKWNFILETCEEENADGMFYSIPAIMDKFKMERIDFLKIDIEGGESVLFDSNTEWLSKIRYLSIELHDFILPGSSNSFFSAISDNHPFSFNTIGENHVVHFYANGQTL